MDNHIQRPASGDHAYWTGRSPTPFAKPAFPLPTPNTPQSALPVPTLQYTPSFLFTPVVAPIPLPYWYQRPAPAADDPPPPLTFDDTDGEFDDDFIPTPQPSPWTHGLPPPQPSPWTHPSPPLPPAPVPPYGWSITPLHPPANRPQPVRRSRRQKRHSYTSPTPAYRPPDILEQARQRSRNESSISLVSMPRWKVEGRPTHWRSGYKPTTCTRIKNCIAMPTCVSSSPTLHTLLLYQFPSQFPLSMDLRVLPTHTSNVPVFHNPVRCASVVDLYQVATKPALVKMQLYHPLLPWFVDIQASDPSGITVGDILYQLQSSLQINITEIDWTNNVISAEDRERFYHAYRLRGHFAGGVKRVDFLGPEVIFRGLRKTGQGWEIKTTNT